MGRIGYDLISEEPGVPLRNVRLFSRYLGGSSANMAVGLARLGLKTAIIGAVSEDPLGDFLVDFLKAEGVDTSQVRRAPGFESSLSLTEVSPPDRFPQVFYRKQAADTQVTLSDAGLRLSAGASMFITNGTSLCASPSREATYRALAAAHEAEVKVILDVDYRAMSWPSPENAGLAVRLALPFVDMLIGNEPELQLTAGRGATDDSVEALRAAGVPVLVSKLGEKGTRLYAAGDTFFAPPLAVEVVSTIGAGDGFASGFLYGFIKGMPWDACLRYGNATAAIVVSRLSCSEAMPRLSEVERMLAQLL